MKDETCRKNSNDDYENDDDNDNTIDDEDDEDENLPGRKPVEKMIGATR